MGAALQGLIAFPGIAQPRRAEFTLSLGTTPSVALVEFTPQQGYVAQLGALQFGFGATTIIFPDCIVDSLSLQRRAQGIVTVARILDRRWRWRFGEINGWYNRRLADGTLDTTLEKTPQELATLLFQAMGESGFDVAQLPNLARPEVKWTAANPAAELSALCDKLGCRVALGLDNVAKIVRIGIGASLPSPEATHASYAVDPPLRPDSLKLIGGPTVHEARIKLVAVGRDTDGTVKLIDDLSYKPSGGWETEWPWAFWSILDQHGNDERALALATVWRWYRITLDPIYAPFENLDTSDIKQILPLGAGLIATYTDEDGEKRPSPPTVQGTYCDGKADFVNVDSSNIDIPFTLDRERGIVQFAEPVFKLGDSNNDYEEAVLTLTVTFPILDTTSRQPRRYSRERTLPGSSLNTLPELIRHDEIVLTRKAEYDSGGNVTSIAENTASVDQEADYHLDAAEAGYQVTTADDLEYRGLLAIAPDGAIHQVHWEVNHQSGARTRASRNNEFSITVPEYGLRRSKERDRERSKIGTAVAAGALAFQPNW